MAAVATFIEIDGPRNVVSKTTGDFLQSALPTGVTILDPSVLTDMNPGMSGPDKATLLSVDYIQYSISDGITVQLFWDASSPVILAELSGRGKIEAKHFGGLQNEGGAGTTGKITMTVIMANEAASTNNETILMILQCKKFRPISVGGA